MRHFFSKFLYFNLILVSFFLIITTYQKSNAQLQVSVRNFTNNPLTSSNSFIEIQVKLKNAPILVEKENVLFQELNFISKTKSIENLPDGWQKVEWIPNHDKILTKVDDAGLVDYVGNIIISYDGNVVSEELLKADINTPKLTVISNTGNRNAIYELFFGNRAIGDSTWLQINANAERLVMDNLQFARPIRMDSITISGEGFYYIWRGTQSTGTLDKTPPFNINGVGDNLVDVFFKPTTDKYYNEIMTFHYNNGAKRYVKLFGNSYNMNYQSKFKLLYPNGGEVLAPCQEIEIKWTGHTLGRMNFVEISFDKGGRWFNAGSTTDSVLKYKVPNLKGDNVLFRVSQKYEESIPYKMENETPIYNIDFKNDGRFLAYPRANTIQEWNLTSSNPILNKSYTLGINPSTLSISDIKYTNYNDYNFMLLYHTESILGIRSQDTIAIFNSTDATPYKKFAFNRYHAKKIIKNPNSELIYLLPELSNLLCVASILDGEILETFSFPIPVTTITVNDNDDELIITFLDGDINVYKKSDFNNGKLNLVRSINIPDVPIIKDCVISPNGKYMSLSFEYDDESLFIDLNQTIILDAKTNEIINIKKETITQTIGMDFSPESNLALYGYAGYEPQILMHDLVKKTDDELEVGPSRLTNLKFSPQGNAFAATTDGGSGGVTVSYRTVNFPIIDLSDSLLSIQIPKHTKITADFGSELIFTEKEKIVANVLCNEGETDFVFDEVRLVEGKHFKLTNNLIPDTLAIGNCKDISLFFTPQDTGVVIDTLVLISCTNEIKIPLTGYGINRTISFAEKPINITEKCIGVEHFLEMDLFENKDNETLKISGFEFEVVPNMNFTAVYPIVDTTLNANGKLKIVFKYRIDTLGDFKVKFKTFHNNQTKYYFENEINVKGIGTYIDLSHKILPFVSEDTKRIITIKNLSLQSVFIDDYIITGSAAFTITSSKNVEIKPNTSADIEVTWDGTPFIEANLFINANPCLVQNNIRIVNYIGTSLITIGNTTSEPTTDGYLLLTMKNTENYPYKGNRKYSATLNLDYQVFFPERIESKYNNLTLTRNPVLNGDRREFTVSAEGDFELDGELMKIWGKPGLSDEDSTNIQISSFDYFGKSVDETYRPGNFKVINICGDRRLLDLAINEINYYPNPTYDKINIEIDSKQEQILSFNIYSSTGIFIEKISSNLIIANNIIEVNLQNYDYGSYNIIIEGQNVFYPIKIIKSE